VNARSKLLDGIALLFAMSFPSAMSWVEFMILPGSGHERNLGLQVTFWAGKLIQFSFPLVYMWLCHRDQLAIRKPSARGLELGALFGLVVGAGALILYFTWLKSTPAMAATPERLFRWLTEFNMATPGGYIVMAFFIAVLHSFLEEYYWRWFVFGRLEKYLPLAVAMALSSLAFMAHHVIVLSVYLHGYFWEAVVPFSLCVAGGGAVWAWLYHHRESLYAPWVSHLLVDLALMALGYDMLAKYWQ
jgi:membrane protease YdiL (CAAX protease family)